MLLVAKQLPFLIAATPAAAAAAAALLSFA
jgi:hypothetical protein